jgi:hypothetical protein
LQQLVHHIAKELRHCCLLLAKVQVAACHPTCAGVLFADLQVQRLQCAAVALHSLVGSLVKLSSYQVPDLKV